MTHTTIRTLAGDSTTQMRSRMHGLAVACPFHQSNPPDCPLCEIRKLPMTERFAWVESLDLVVMDDYFRKHDECLRAKEAEEDALGS